MTPHDADRAPPREHSPPPAGSVSRNPIASAGHLLPPSHRPPRPNRVRAAGTMVSTPGTKPDRSRAQCGLHQGREHLAARARPEPLRDGWRIRPPRQDLEGPGPGTRCPRCAGSQRWPGRGPSGRHIVTDSLVFDASVLRKVSDDAASIRIPDVPAGDVPFDRLTDRLVKWGRVHLEPVTHRRACARQSCVGPHPAAAGTATRCPRPTGRSQLAWHPRDAGRRVGRARHVGVRASRAMRARPPP